MTSRLFPHDEDSLFVNSQGSTLPKTNVTVYLDSACQNKAVVRYPLSGLTATNSVLVLDDEGYIPRFIGPDSGGTTPGVDTLYVKGKDGTVKSVRARESRASSWSGAIPDYSITNAKFADSSVDGRVVSAIPLSKVSGLQVELSSKASDGSVVHLSGDETIGGIKNFADAIYQQGNPVLTTESGIMVSQVVGLSDELNRKADAADTPSLNRPETVNSLWNFGNGLQVAGEDVLTAGSDVLISQVTGLSSALESKADDAATVHKSGTEQITGSKTFTLPPIVPVGSFAIDRVKGLKESLDSKVSVSQAVTLDTVQQITGAKTFADINVPAGSRVSFFQDALDIAWVRGLRAELDSKGSTSQIQSSISAVRSEMVDKSSDQIVGGVKTFLNAPIVPQGSWSVDSTAGLQSALDDKAPVATSLTTNTAQDVSATKTFAAEGMGLSVVNDAAIGGSLSVGGSLTGKVASFTDLTFTGKFSGTIPSSSIPDNSIQNAKLLDRTVSSNKVALRGIRDENIDGMVVDKVLGGRLLVPVQMGEGSIITTRGDTHQGAGVTLSKSGISVYDSADNPTFVADSTTGDVQVTGVVNAKGGNFSGSISTTNFTLNGGTFTAPTIQGGNLDIASLEGHFKADSNGIYLGADGTWENSPFTVDMTGTMKASNVHISGGTMRVGDKFSVASDGTMVASGATFSGNIRAANIDASNAIRGEAIVAGTLALDRLAVGVATKTDLATTDGILSQVRSQGNNFVRNGSGQSGDNSNFANLDFNGQDAPVGAVGSFYSLVNAQGFSPHGTAIITDTLAIDPTKPFRISFMARQTKAGGSGVLFGFIAPYDAAGIAIMPTDYMYVAGTTTTLAQPLRKGDTKVYLSSVANWYGQAGKPAVGFSHFRSFRFWGYTDKFGKTWEPGTYSKNPWAADQWADGSVDPTTNTITLRVPWAGNEYPAGHPVSNGTSGSSYIYMPSCTSRTVPETWTRFGDTFSAGVLPRSAQAVAKEGAATWATGIPEATAGIKVGWLVNYPSGNQNSRHAIANVSVSDVDVVVDQINAWKKPGTTYINGGQIATDSVSAQTLSTSSLLATTTLTVGDATTGLQVNDANNFLVARKGGVNQFTVDKSGNATFAGTLQAAGGTFAGALKGGTVEIGSGNSILKGDANGLYLGNSSFPSAPFSVDLQGNVKMTSASLIGPVIAGGSIKIGSGASVFRADSQGIYLGGEDFTKAPYRVSSDGSLTANSVDIRGGQIRIGDKFSVASDGTVTASNGNFNGSINANSGSVGGWSISKDRLYGGTTAIIEAGNVLGSTITGGVVQTSDNHDAPRVWIDSNGLHASDGLQQKLNFNTSTGILTLVGGGQFTGDLVAAGGTFSGELKAASGTFSGVVQADSLVLGMDSTYLKYNAFEDSSYRSSVSGRSMMGGIVEWVNDPSRSTGAVYDGQWSMRFNQETNTTTKYSKAILVAPTYVYPDTRISYTFYSKLTALTGDVTLNFEFLDSNGAVVLSRMVSAIKATSWTENSGTISTPAGAATVSVYAYARPTSKGIDSAAPAGTPSYLDRVSIVRKAEPPQGIAPQTLSTEALSGQISETQISDGAISTPKLMANAIDGMTIRGTTLIGSVMKTDVSPNPRVEMSYDSAMQRHLRFYSGRTEEVRPGSLGAQVEKSFNPDTSAYTYYPQTELRSPSTSKTDPEGSASFIQLRGSDSVGIESAIVLSARNIFARGNIWADADLSIGNVQASNISASSLMANLDRDGGMTYSAPVSLNGWTSYGTPFQALFVRRVGRNMAMIAGLIRPNSSGTWSSGTVYTIGNVPPWAVMPSTGTTQIWNQQFMCANKTFTNGTIRIAPGSGTIQWVPVSGTMSYAGDVSNYMAINAIYPIDGSG